MDNIFIKINFISKEFSRYMLVLDNNFITLSPQYYNIS